MNTVLRALKAFGVTIGIPLLAMFLCLVLFLVLLAGGFVWIYLFFGRMAWRGC